MVKARTDFTSTHCTSEVKPRMTMEAADGSSAKGNCLRYQNFDIFWWSLRWSWLEAFPIHFRRRSFERCDAGSDQQLVTAEIKNKTAQKIPTGLTLNKTYITCAIFYRYYPYSLKVRTGCFTALSVYTKRYIAVKLYS